MQNRWFLAIHNLLDIDKVSTNTAIDNPVLDPALSSHFLTTPPVDPSGTIGYSALCELKYN